MVSALGLNNSQSDQDKPSNPTLNLQVDRKIYQGVIQPKGFPPLPEDWCSEWETFPSADGALQLYSVIHHPKNWTGHRALVVLHGIGEHGGRYLHVAHFVRSVVDAVYCLDHRGHGRSEGLRGHIDQFDLFGDDLSLALFRLDELLTKRFHRSEIHLLAHSLGGLIALRALIQHPNLPIKSVTLSAPALGVKVKIPLIKKIVGRILAKTWGSIHLKSEIDARQVSHDKEVVEAYNTDRLVHNKVTPKLFTEVEMAIQDTLKRDLTLQVPLQMLIPGQDFLVDSEVSLDFFKRLKLRDKRLKTYPNFFHESLNEIGKEQAFDDVCSWIREHSS